MRFQIITAELADSVSVVLTTAGRDEGGEMLGAYSLPCGMWKTPTDFDDSQRLIKHLILI